MEKFIKKNINKIVAIFLILQPFLDLITGICIHTLKINFTLGVIVRLVFLLFMCLIVIFAFKKKKILIPYLIIGIYFASYIFGTIMFKNSNYLFEIQNLVKVFYFPLLFVSLYSIKDYIRISNLTLFTIAFLYLVLLFVPTVFGVGYKTYEITKAGTLGFFNSANEISGIISILTPIMFIIFYESKKIIPIILFIILYLSVILMIGTKTPLLSLLITTGISLLYLWKYLFKNKQFKYIIVSILVIVLGLVGLVIIGPKTNFYKNIRTHLDYLKLDHVTDVFKDEKLVDHFIFSSRLKFLHNKSKIYKNANLYQKVYGIGYINNNKETKMIEMDYFDIFFSHGIVGFLIFFIISIYMLFKTIEKPKKYSFQSLMIHTSIFFIGFLAFFTGHILTAPSVSILCIIIILSLSKRNKKDLLFASVSMDLGGIEKALLNLINRVDPEKYNVDVILEEKKGIFLNYINPNINVKELKVSNNKNIVIRKITNYTRKLIYTIFNYKNYDFSCCYATYSYSSSKIALISSNNTAFYVHNDYRVIYSDINEFKHFFNSRNIYSYKNIVFVSNENKMGFVEIYSDLKDKCKVLNNFINTEEIISQSKEDISIKRTSKKKLFMYIGRLDEDAKKISRQINLVYNIKDIELWIIGDGQDRKEYEKEINDKKLNDRIKFFGKQKNPFPYMAMADYIILTSDYEGFPVTYLEAITLNKKIITTFPTSDDTVDISEYANIIDKDKDKMIEQIKTILKEGKQPEKIDIEKGQKTRMRKFEKMFDEVV